jgi:hypothetical protein
MMIFVKYRPSCNMRFKDYYDIPGFINSNLLNKQTKEFSGDLNFGGL